MRVPLFIMAAFALIPLPAVAQNAPLPPATQNLGIIGVTRPAGEARALGPTPPIPVESPASWIRSDDYPPAAVRSEIEGTVGFTLEVDRLGRVDDCAVTESSGNTDLDRATCELLRSRGRFLPARNAYGRARSGSWSSRMVWQLYRPPPPMPAPGSYAVAAIVEPDGTVSSCEFPKSNEGESPLGNGLCVPGMQFEAPVDARGAPTRRRLRIEINVAQDDLPTE